MGLSLADCIEELTSLVEVEVWDDINEERHEEEFAKDVTSFSFAFVEIAAIVF